MAVKVTADKLIVIILIMTLKFSLLCQGNTERHADNQNIIKIKPLYLSELSQTIQENEDKELKQSSEQSQKTSSNIIKRTPEWILESSIYNAPALLKGIIFYLQSRSLHNEFQRYTNVSSCHRFILVGPPGSGKTTMAYAIAHVLDYPVAFIGAAALLGHFRNQTAKNIQGFLRECTSDGLKKVIIIDELHKLFELYGNDHSDDSQSAAAFWLAIDTIEKYYPNVVIIATANNVDRLPPEIKSRFSGKIITMSLPNEKQKIRAFKNSIAYDESVIVDESVTDLFIIKIISQIHNGSLRDIQLLIDTAKMFYYAENSIYPFEKEYAYMNEYPIALTRSHFQHAIDQLQKESKVLEGSLIEQLRKKLDYWGLIFSSAANISFLMTTFFNISKKVILFLG